VIGPLMTSDACQAHTSHHVPTPLLCEKHHVLPQSWQATWSPVGNKRRLWAPATVTLCPTAHRNVHVWIPRMMRIVERVGEPTDLDVLRKQVRWEHDVRRPSTEFFVAERALFLFREAGGRLMDLVAASEYGYGLARPS
jgi:hypothetical protein